MTRFHLAIATAVTTIGLLIPAAAAGATTLPVRSPAPPSRDAQPWALSLSPSATAQHKVVTIPLSPGSCAAAKREVAHADPGAAPLKRCVVGVGLVVGRSRPGPAPSQASRTAPGHHAATWYYNTVKATMCWGDAPIWGGPNHSFSCAEGFVYVSGEYAYNGYNAWYQWIYCGWATTSNYLASVHPTWCGIYNNGAHNPPGYMDFGLNAEYTFGPGGGLGAGTMWERIDVYYWGLLQLRGGWDHT